MHHGQDRHEDDGGGGASLRMRIALRVPSLLVVTNLLVDVGTNLLKHVFSKRLLVYDQECLTGGARGNHPVTTVVG